MASRMRPTLAIMVWNVSVNWCNKYHSNQSKFSAVCSVLNVFFSASITFFTVEILSCLCISLNKFLRHSRDGFWDASYPCNNGVECVRKFMIYPKSHSTQSKFSAVCYILNILFSAPITFLRLNFFHDYVFRWIKFYVTQGMASRMRPTLANLSRINYNPKNKIMLFYFK